MSRLELAPMDRDGANLFVELHHRHSKVVQGYRFALAAAVEGEVVAVAIVGRPVARGLQDGWTVEALRVCAKPWCDACDGDGHAAVDQLGGHGTCGACGGEPGGYPNACSFLYGACWRAARALGYRRLVTYTLASEGGASLRAAGLRVVGELPSRGERGWNTPARPRVEVPGQERLRWELSA